jgi:hypothetical protein
MFRWLCAVVRKPDWFSGEPNVPSVRKRTYRLFKPRVATQILILGVTTPQCHGAGVGHGIFIYAIAQADSRTP